MNHLSDLSDHLPDALTPKREDPSMRTVGLITTVLVAAVVALAVVLVVLSAPDIKRYLRMRQM